MQDRCHGIQELLDGVTGKLTVTAVATAKFISRRGSEIPSRASFPWLFSSIILSSNLGEMRVYVCDHDTALPEEQVIKINGMNILIKALQINKEKKKKGKRSVTRTLESRSLSKRANTGGSLSTSRQGSSNTPSEKILQFMTIE
ncbi:DET1- and DDB1-associated protein 1 N-terminal [Dioscorea alata]|uniref:DET1- and DDB1-associated protein 1 N-terminal n=1 Tax=Dioscorea alata TaxID=55571 RepID=A0ACB7V1C7_DIOAL|nr:DET1- and DDB1-associated protein 1 N-terminal [Dioscorea alata]